MIKRLVAVGLVVLILFGVVSAKKYYDNRYLFDDAYYVYVPASQSIELEDLLDSSGKVVDKGKSYEFVGMNRDGETKRLQFTYSTEDVTKLIQPDSYLKVDSSKTIVLGQSVIQKSDVPVEIVDKIITRNP